MRPRLLLLLALLPTLLVPMLAQRRDLRLSPPEPVTRVLPDTIRIQAADRYGDLALVVWGSNRRLANGTHVTCLWARLMRDSTQVGLPFLVHPDNARPSRRVAVSAQRDRFAVAWLDSRADAAGIYVAVIDTSGLIVRPAKRAAAATEVELLRVHASGADEHVLLWSERKGKTIALRLSSQGAPLAPQDTIGTRVTWVRRMATAIDGCILHFDNTRRFAVGRRIEGLRLVAAPVCEPYVIREDGAVVTVCHDTVRLFSSLFDTTLYRERPVPMVDSLKLILGIPAIAGDTIMLLGLTRRDSSKHYQERLHRARLDDELALAHDTILLSRVEQYGVPFTLGVRGSLIVRVRGCENLYRLDATLAISVSGYHGNEETYMSTTSYLLDGTGRATSDRDTTVSSCDPVALRRIAFDSVSIVVAGRDTFSTATEVIAWNQSQRSPALVLANGEVCLVWMVDGPTPYMLRRWPHRADTLTTPVDSMLPPRIQKLAHNEVMHQATDWLHQSFGQASVSANHFRLDEDRQGLVNFPRSFTYLAVHRATAGGWRRTVLGQKSDWYHSLVFEEVPIAHDPISGLATGGFTRREPGGVYSSFVAYSIDTSGLLADSIWLYRDIGPDRHVLSAGPRSYFLCDAATMRYVGHDTIHAVSRFERVVSRASFQRLRGARILRWWRDSLDQRRVHLERYEPNGAHDGRTELMLASATGELVLAESLDGTLLFVHADTAVEVHRVSPDLTPVGAPMRLSELDAIARQPSAVVLGDTLIVVWEDWRNVEVDIYGTTIAVRDIRSHVSPARSAAPVLLAHVGPTPARDALGVTLVVPALDVARLALVDAGGAIRALGSIEPGRIHARMELDGIESGVYVLIARSGERTETSRVVVVR